MQEKSKNSIAYIAFFGGLYLALSLLNPFDFGVFSFRVANTIRGGYLFMPEISFGVMIANLINNFLKGKLFGTHLILPFLNVVFAYTAYAIAKKSKALALLFLTASFSAVIAYNYAVFAKVPWIVAFASKFVTEGITMTAGYFAFKKAFRR